MLKTLMYSVFMCFSVIAIAGDSLEQKISASIKGLGSEKWEAREASQAKLLELGAVNGELAIQKSMEAYIGNKDPEVRERLKKVIRSLAIENSFKARGFIGISMQPTNSVIEMGNVKVTPVLIIDVVPDFPAEKAGFKQGDMLLKVDEKLCDMDFQTQEIVAYISAKKPGTKITITLQSGENQIAKEVTVAERPALSGEQPVKEQQGAFFKDWFKSKLEEMKNKAESENQKE